MPATAGTTVTDVHGITQPGSTDASFCQNAYTNPPILLTVNSSKGKGSDIPAAQCISADLVSTSTFACHDSLPTVAGAVIITSCMSLLISASQHLVHSVRWYHPFHLLCSSFECSKLFLCRAPEHSCFHPSHWEGSPWHYSDSCFGTIRKEHNRL